MLPGVELVFSGTQADKTPISFRDISKADGAYGVTVLSGRTYQVAVSKDGKNIETQEFAVPVSTNDTTTITKNFYVNYIDTTVVNGLAFKNIYFDTDKYFLRPESITELNKIAATLKSYAGVNISVEGHCDSRNTDEYNMVLGQNRAEAAYNYLTTQGIAQTRMATVSYGERKPMAPNDSEQNMQLNRRDEFKVVLKEGEKMPVIKQSNGTPGADMKTPAASTATVTAPTPAPAPGKTKMKMADGTKVKTKVDEDSDKVKVKVKGANGNDSKTTTKNGAVDAKAKDASGEKTKIKAKPE